VSEQFPQTRTVIVARLLIAVLISVAALVGGTNIEIVAIVILGVIVAALTGVYLLWERFDKTPFLLLRVQFGVDIVFVTLLAYFSGGLASPFKLLYFLPVFVGSARLGFRTGTVLAAASVAGYLFLSLADPGGWRYLEESGAPAEIAILILSLLLVAALVGYLARTAGESEQELRETRFDLDTARLRIANIIDSMRSGLVLVDSDGRVVHMNATGARILGIREEDVRDREYRVVFADVPAFYERISTALEAGRPETRAEFFVRRKGGGTLPVGLSTSILRDDLGEERGVIAIFQDLTEARRMEERLRHEDRLAALGEFAAGLAHEIRNPLNAIRGSIDLLREDLEATGDEARLLDLVTREADRLNNLAQDVLNFGRMESTERESVRLDRLLEEVAVIARNHPSYRTAIALTVDAEAEVEGVVNTEELRRAILNLTINAIEAIESKGEVRLLLITKETFAKRGLEAGAEYDVAIVVEDTGCGVASDRRNEIFQPFKTSKKGGTGLGLSIVDKIVQSHGGRITIASEPGRGSRFVVYLST
jgi:two-component system sensor histidine kinase PilS (NtrC family)